jgi:hypothetical protein
MGSCLNNHVALGLGVVTDPLMPRSLCSAVSVRSRRVTLLHEMPSPSSDWTARQPHARGWLG